MRRFSVIGTAHVKNADLFEALEAALEDAAPDQLLLEIPDAAVRSGDMAGQKPEMLMAYQWAKQRGIPIRGHEPAGPPILRDGLDAERLRQLVLEMEALIANLPVRETIDVFCGRSSLESATEQRLDAVVRELVDPQKALARTQAMIKEVHRVASADGAIVIVCGGAHAPHLVTSLPECRIVHGQHFY